MHCKDWLNYNLTGVIGTDFSDASTAALDVLERRYVGELFERLGLPGALALLPEPRPSAAPLGRVTRAAAERTGLPEGLPVMAGALDVAAVAAGAGAVRPGDAVTVVGTTLCNEVVLERAQVDPADPRGSTLCHVLPDRWLRLMATSSGTSSLDWARRQLAPDLTFARLEAELAGIPPAARASCSSRSCTGSAPVPQRPGLRRLLRPDRAAHGHAPAARRLRRAGPGVLRLPPLPAAGGPGGAGRRRPPATCCASCSPTAWAAPRSARASRNWAWPARPGWSGPAWAEPAPIPNIF